MVQYSREIKHEKYSSVEVITVAEAFKMLLSAILLLNDDRGSSSSSASSSSSPAPSDSLPSHSSLVSSSDKAHPSSFPWYLQLHALISSGRKMLVLVVLYTVSNLCSLYAAGTVGASVSTVFAQLKVLTTAVCGVLVLGKTYSTRKWLCLLVLVVGCVCVSFPTLKEAYSLQKETPPTSSPSSVMLHEKLLGMLCLLLQISISGFASVYFELVLKDRQDVVTIWERNFQLAFYSVLFTLLMIAAKNGYSSYSYSSAGESSETSEGGLSYSYLLSQLAGGASRRTDLFAGWTRLAVGTALCQGCAGLFVAATLKYADAILKCFASSLAIIVVTMVNSGLFGQSIDTIVKLGVVLAIGAMLTYSLDTDVIVIHNSKHKKNN